MSDKKDSKFGRYDDSVEYQLVVVYSQNTHTKNLSEN